MTDLCYVVSSPSRGQADTVWPEVPGERRCSHQTGPSTGLELPSQGLGQRANPFFGHTGPFTTQRPLLLGFMV